MRTTVEVDNEFIKKIDEIIKKDTSGHLNSRPKVTKAIVNLQTFKQIEEELMKIDEQIRSKVWGKWK